MDDELAAASRLLVRRGRVAVSLLVATVRQLHAFLAEGCPGLLLLSTDKNNGNDSNGNDDEIDDNDEWAESARNLLPALVAPLVVGLLAWADVAFALASSSSLSASSCEGFGNECLEALTAVAQQVIVDARPDREAAVLLALGQLVREHRRDRLVPRLVPRPILGLRRLPPAASP